MDKLVANGKEYILKYTFRALDEMQDRGINLTQDQEFRFKDVVQIIQLGLKKYQPELTEDNVWDICDDLMEQMDMEDLMLIVQTSMEKAVGKRKPKPRKKA